MYCELRVHLDSVLWKIILMKSALYTLLDLNLGSFKCDAVADCISANYPQLKTISNQLFAEDKTSIPWSRFNSTIHL